jgi:hypothetical protein
MPDQRPLTTADVEVLLADVATHLEWPPLPDGVSAACNRLAAGEQAHTRPRRRWPFVLAAVAVALLALLVLVIPPARRAVANLFGLGGVTVRQVPTTVPATLSTVPVDIGDLQLGTPVTLEEARARAASPLFVPTELGDPNAVYAGTANGHPVFTVVYHARPGLPAAPQTSVGLLVTEFAGRFAPYIEKQVGPGQAKRISIGGQPALWIEGPHTLIYADQAGDVSTSRSRLAANTLVVSRGGTTIRLEGAFDQATAVRLARSLG